jgi:hypothetical protein
MDKHEGKKIHNTKKIQRKEPKNIIWSILISKPIFELVPCNTIQSYFHSSSMVPLWPHPFSPPPKPLRNESLYVATMVDYESLKNMFCFLKVKNMRMKHWFDNLGWDIVCNPQKKKLIKESPFLVLF